jgi:hypothetical protein
MPTLGTSFPEKYVEEVTFGVLKSMNVDIIVFLDVKVSRGSAVGIATGYELDLPRGQNSSPGRVKNFHFYISSRPSLGSTQSPIYWVTGTPPGKKRQEREVNNWAPSSTKVKKTWVYRSTLPYVFKA